MMKMIEILEACDFLLGKCVICNQPTRYQLVNGNTGMCDFVCHYENENSLDCINVWRYRTAQCMDSVYVGREEDTVDFSCEQNDTKMFYRSNHKDVNKPIECFSEYSDYIHSKEWHIKMKRAKQIAGFQCEDCGFQCFHASRSNQLDAHHNNYKCLYHETKKDIDVLCRECHKKRHDGWD